MNLLPRIRERIGAVVGAAAAALCFCVMGAFLAFYISPQQAIEWRQIQALPELDAAGFAAAASGTEVAVTGTLQGNEPLTAEGFVAYEQQVWNVKTSSSSDEDDRPAGDWETVKTLAPELTIAIHGGTIRTVSATSATFSGNLHEVIVPGHGPSSADYNGQQLADGSTRTRGFFNGDLITVVGQKGVSGDLVPRRLYGGDRIGLVNEIHTGARVAFVVGVICMIVSPMIAVGGILGALFGRIKHKP